MDLSLKSICLGLTLIWSGTLCAPYVLASENLIDTQWLASLGDEIPDYGDLPDGLDIIPIGLRYETVRRVIPLKPIRRNTSNIYRFVSETIVVSPERRETIVIPAIIDENGTVIKPEQVKHIIYPPVTEQITRKEIVRRGKQYNAIISDIPRYRISREVTGIKGYSLIDQNQKVVRSWSYVDGKLKLDDIAK